MGTAVLIVLGLIVLWAVMTFNSLVRSRNEIRNAWSQIDVQLRRRHDLVPNLVEAVQGAMDFERETLTRVIEARNQAVKARDGKAGEISAAESALGQALAQFLAVVEQYPDLKANRNVSQLQEELTSTENRIAYARQFLNDRVLHYNNLVEMFPSSLIAQAGAFGREEYLQIEDHARAVPRVSLR